MLKRIFTLFSLLFATGVSAEVIAKFPFTSDFNSIDLANNIASATFSGATLDDEIIGNHGFGNVLQAYHDGSSIDNSTTHYYTLEINASMARTFNISKLQYEVGKGGSSDTRGYIIRSSVDSFATDVISTDLPTGSQTAPALNEIDFSANSDYSNLTTLTLRFYVYSPNTFNSVDFRNIVFNTRPNTDATLTASSTIEEPIPLPSTADTTGEAVNLFDFTITDGGTSDGLSTDVSQIVLHISGTADFSKVTWRLNGANVSNVGGVYNSGANTLTFSGLAISVADGGSQTYTLSGYYSTPTGLTNNQTYIVSLDGDDDLTLSASGTQMSGLNAVVNNGTGSVVAITASKLMFQTLPSN